MRKIDYIKKIRAIEKENRLLKEANNSFGREDRIKFIECLYRTDKETLKCLIADLEELKTKYSFKEKNAIAVYISCVVCEKISELIGVIEITHNNFK